MAASSAARLAQSVERETLNLKVVGSTPTSGSIPDVSDSEQHLFFPSRLKRSFLCRNFFFSLILAPHVLRFEDPLASLVRWQCSHWWDSSNVLGDFLSPSQTPTEGIGLQETKRRIRRGKNVQGILNNLTFLWSCGRMSWEWRENGNSLMTVPSLNWPVSADIPPPTGTEVTEPKDNENDEEKEQRRRKKTTKAFRH